jgi:hypothetical protein
MQTFFLGSIGMTNGARYALSKASVHPLELIQRHSKLDPGCLDAEDQESNQRALADGGRIFSAYMYGERKFWVITEADRSSTTILLPDEY